MTDADKMKKLKEQYFELITMYGEEVAELKPFRESLLRLNKKHREDVLKMYVKIISKIENKVTGIMPDKK